LDFGVLPGGRNCGSGTDAKLHDEARNDAEEGSVVIEMMLYQIVETIGAERSPGPGDGNGESTSRRVELHLVGVGSFFEELLGCEQGLGVSGPGVRFARGMKRFRGGRRGGPPEKGGQAPQPAQAFRSFAARPLVSEAAVRCSCSRE